MSSPRERIEASLADRYRVERELGQGGMATVYLAEDLKHRRRVALKVLKPELAAVLGAERFVQEITTTASMSHPHILPLFDSGSADGFLFYVMPFIEGETLRDKLNRETQLGVDEAVRIAREVADALDYAHRHGVIHRDIKPENVLLHDGRPMVADFGIALAVSAAAGGRMTETGLSLGTPHYMSPEQATAEKEITGRSDVYSLASVLYEMLAGQPPHLGGSAQQIIMKIIAEPVEAVTRYRKAVPPHVAAAVAKALEKLPADRFESAKAFAQALADPAFRHGTPVSGFREVPRDGRVTNRRPMLVGASATIAAGLLGVWLGTALSPSTERESSGTLRFAIELPSDSGVPPLAAGLTSVAITPDGRTIIAGGAGPAGVPHLFARDVDDLEWRLIPGTGRSTYPIVSPDGEWVAFIADGALMKVRLAGGTPIELARVGASSLALLTRGTWGAGDRILLSLNGRLASIPGAGGAMRILPIADSGAVQAGQVSPVLLGTGDHVIFGLNTGTADGEIHVAGIEDRVSVRLDVRGRPVAVEDGLLLFVDALGTLSAIRFDERTRRTIGDPIRVIAPNLGGGRTDRGVAAVSSTGALVWIGGDTRSDLIFAEIGGRDRVRASWPTSSVVDPRVSPDGKQVVVFVDRDIWIVPIAEGTAPQRVTSDSSSFRPEWTPDGKRIAYRAISGGRSILRHVDIDGGGDGPTDLVLDRLEIWQGVYSPDSRFLALRTGTQAGSDIWYRAVTGDTTLKPVSVTAAVEHSPQFSPDGKWIAYVSTESGTEEVYVRAFPPARAAQRISLTGAEEPMWSPDGRDLYYRAGQELVRATLRVEPSFTVLDRTTVRSNYNTNTLGHASFDISADGRSLVIGRVTALNSHLVYLHDGLREIRARFASTPP